MFSIINNQSYLLFYTKESTLSILWVIFVYSAKLPLASNSVRERSSELVFMCLHFIHACYMPVWFQMRNIFVFSQSFIFAVYSKYDTYIRTVRLTLSFNWRTKKKKKKKKTLNPTWNVNINTHQVCVKYEHFSVQVTIVSFLYNKLARFVGNEIIFQCDSIAWFHWMWLSWLRIFLKWRSI